MDLQSEISKENFILNFSSIFYVKFHNDIGPDSLASYKEFIEVQKSIDFSNQGIKFTYQFSPLTWHFYAFKINQAFFFVLQERGAQQAAKFISHVFANQ